MNDRDNLVKTTTWNFDGFVCKVWGKEFDKPDIAYEFSNGRKFQSTDGMDGGIYERD